METLYRDPKTATEACAGTALQHIIQKAELLLALDHYTQTILPDTLKTYCHVMNAQNGVLILGVSSAGVAMRLKMQSKEIVQKIQQEKRFAHIRDLKCTVCAKTIRY